MEVVLLGSGSADGWPNPFCRCASCSTQRTSGVRRVSTSALVDGTLLLDLGPDTARQAETLGVDLGEVRHVLVTHAHPDHLAPAGLLWRQWAAGPADPLTVWGPASVTDEVARWLGDDRGVRVRSVHPGDELQVGEHAVRVLAAAHDVETVLFDVADARGSRLLYATDTGPLPATTVASLADRAYDVALIEETFGRVSDHGTGHLDLTTFPQTLQDMRAVGAITAATRTVAVHLGHHNPPETELRTVLAAWGAEPGRDGEVIVTSPEAAGRAPDANPDANPHRALILGGARSGKSALAERLLADTPDVLYVATGGHRPDDLDWQQRVRAHQARRPASWATLATTDLGPLLRSPGPTLLIDCLTLWLTAVMDEVDAWAEDVWASSASAALHERVNDLVDALRATSRRVVAVSNEVGGGVVPDSWPGRVFRDEMGRLNARIAAECESVTLVVAGMGTRLR